MSIAAIIILYNPDKESAAKAVQRIAAQTDEVFVIDNSDADNAGLFNGQESVEYIALKHNAGIAAAQNEGIRKAAEQKYDFVAFCDQDSSISDNAIKRLTETFLKIKSEGVNIGGIGTLAINEATGEPYPYGISKIGDYNSHVDEVSYLMNSISIYPTRLLIETGMMNEELFIDGVDSELCWRLTHKRQSRFFIDKNVTIQHNLGIGQKNIGNRNISVTPPYRMYYQYRNFLWLARRKYVPLNWKLYNGFKYVIKMIYYPLTSPQRKEYVKYITQGIKEGLSKNKIQKI